MCQITSVELPLADFRTQLLIFFRTAAQLLSLRVRPLVIGIDKFTFLSFKHTG